MELQLSGELPGGSPITIATTQITITDDDPPATISISGATFSEAVGSASFTVTRTGSTEAAVDFTYSTTNGTASAGSDYTAVTDGPGSISAGTGGSTTVTVPITDDGFDESDEDFTVAITGVTSGNATATGGPATGTIQDNDTKGVTIDELDGVSASESGATDTYTVVLNSQPTAPVTITITPAGSQATAAPTPLTFTAGPTSNWDTPQVVTVTAVDDDIDDGDLPETFTHAASGGDYSSGVTVAPVVATTVDDDVRGVTLTPLTVPVTEGGATGTYDVVLDTQPTATVTITVTGDAQATALPATLTFTAGPTGNWDVAQTVTITAVDDMVAEAQPHTGTISHTAAGGDYAGITIDDVEAEITDDDSAGVSIDTDDGVTVTEASGAGNSDTYEIVLTTQPTASVTVLIADTSTEYGRSPTSLTFTGGPTGNWDTPQIVTVTGTDDDVDDGDTTPSITHTATSADANYDGITVPAVVVSVIDDDEVGVTVSQTAAVVVEGGVADPYTVILDSEPTSNVVITLDTTTDEATIDKTSLTFTPANWDTAQTVSITATDDDIIDGETTDTITHSASGGGYTGVGIASVGVTVTDDDVASVTIVESGGSTDVIEGADTDTYTLVLDAEPGSDVVISISTDGQTIVSPAVVTFTPANWDVAQTITVSGVEDGIDEVPSHPGVIQHSAAGDPDFVGITIDDVVANVGDADALLVSIEGPTFGASGKASSFMAMVNAGGTGAITYDWTVFFGGNPVADGDEATFQFTPTQTGAYIIAAVVGDDQGQNPAVFINFTALGDIGESVFVDDIIWLAEEGITRGCNPPANDQFCPDRTVTRGQMAAFLVRFLDLTAIDPTISFTDTGGNIFEQDILKLATAGITRGCNAEGTEFCPDRGVTRGQMAAFLVRAFGLTDNGGGNLFTDDDASIFEDDIDKLATAGITRGCNPPTNDNFCPDRTVTRGQMAAFLRRAEPLI